MRTWKARDFATPRARITCDVSATTRWATKRISRCMGAWAVAWRRRLPRCAMPSSICPCSKTMELKNLFGAIHNPNKYHLNVGDPYVADVNMLPPIRQKVRLHICDATTAQYEGGPSYMPQWTWPCNSLLVSRDPVALDFVG